MALSGHYKYFIYKLENVIDMRVIKNYIYTDQVYHK